MNQIARDAASSIRARQAVRGLAGCGSAFFRAGAVERIGLIKTGILASEAKIFISYVSGNQGEALRALNIAPATLNRKIKGEERLPAAETERVLGVAKLLGQVEAMVEDGGEPDGAEHAGDPVRVEDAGKPVRFDHAGNPARPGDAGSPVRSNDAGEPVRFDAAAWLSRWLGEPLPALGGLRPRDLLDTIEGQTLVSANLARIGTGAYA